MKKYPQNLKLIIFILAAPVLVACEQENLPGPELHDSKYSITDENCVLDQFTGLIWEVKSDTEGLHDWRNTYSWYSPDESFGGELDYRGTANGGSCNGSDCDIHAWVTVVNEAGLCGYHDWRIASKDELASISDPRKVDSPPTINIEYFPYTQAGEYWSGNDYSFQWDAAWLWNFEMGHDRVEWKASPRFARLVRGEAAQLERVKD